jgi:hypothetical protein
VDVHVKRLRGNVEVDPANPTRIITIRGLGYKYEVPKSGSSPEPERPPASVSLISG